MSISTCLAKTRVFFLVLFASILTIVGIAIIGATSYYGMAISKRLGTNIYIGLAAGFITFIFPLLLTCGSYSSRCYLIFYNYVIILLSLAETIFVAMYFIPSTVDIVKRLLDLPENYYQFIQDHQTVILIVGGCLLLIQFITVVLAGVHASEARQPLSDTPLIPSEDIEENRPTYKERAREKYNLDKYDH